MFDTAQIKKKMMEAVESRLGKGKKNGDHLMYLCPFHRERTPSFAVYEDHFHCYGCEISGDVIKFIQMFDKVDFKEACHRLGAEAADDKQLNDWKAELEKRRLEEEAKKKEARSVYNDSGPWKAYHQALDAKAREQWEKWGIAKPFQDWWKLGWTPDRGYEFDGQIFHTPAFTMPMWSFPNGQPSHVQTCQYRLVKYQDGAGKFRFEKGLGTAAFITHNDWGLGGVDLGTPQVLVLEGPRKAATIVAMGVAPEHTQVIGIPSKGDTGGIVEILKLYERVWVWLDPDVRFKPSNAPETWEAWDVKLCKTIGKQARYIRYGMKSDDAVLAKELDKYDIMRLLKSAEMP